MASPKRGARASKRASEPVPTDDPVVASVVARAREVPEREPFCVVFESWLSAPARLRPGSYFAFADLLARRIEAPEWLPFVFEVLPRLDEARVIDVLTLGSVLVAGEHRNWLGGERFDPEPVGRDLVRRRHRGVILESFAAIAPYVSDPSEEVRARLAFLLAWLGDEGRSLALPLLQTLAADAEPAPRATALVALAMHRETDLLGPALADEPAVDPRVRLCAAIAASWASMTDAAIDVLESALTRAPVLWPALPFNNGALTDWAMLRYGASCGRDAARATPRFVAALEVKGAPVAAIIAAACAGWTPGAPYTELQRGVVAKIIETPTLQTASCMGALQQARVLPAMGWGALPQLFDELRARFELPRPPPTTGPTTLVTVEGETRFAQHWWADFASRPRADGARIAAAIAESLTTAELVELLLRSAQEFDGTGLLPERWSPVAYDVAAPTGFTVRDRALEGPGDGWADSVRAWIAAREREGWLLEGLWWYTADVTVDLFDLSGRWLQLQCGHDWNQGNPDYSRTTGQLRARHRLTPLVARAARARDPAAFDQALEAELDKAIAPNVSARWVGARAAQLALYAVAGTADEPPSFYDRGLCYWQRYSPYVTPIFVAYSRIVSAPRREAIALTCATESPSPLPAFYAVAATPAVLEAILPKLRSAQQSWDDYVVRERRQWARVLGDDVAEDLVRRVTEGLPKKKRRR
jgi:hypothetical protein